MNKIMKFKIEIEGLEEKIWWEIEIIDRMTIADWAYTVLANRSGLGYHVWLFFSEKVKAARARKLGSLLLSKSMECNDSLKIVIWILSIH